MKRFMVLVLVSMIGLAFGFFGAPALTRALRSGSLIGHAQWASSARTVAEETTEADVIVKAKVEVRLPTQAMVVPLPAAAIGPGRPSVDVIPFTETRMKVIEVFKGIASDEISVRQTGGQLAATTIHPAIDSITEDDPLYVEGSEHILFLTRVLDASGREIYLTVNPAGRYEIRGGQVSSPAEFFDLYAPPKTLGELTLEIYRSLGG